MSVSILSKNSLASDTMEMFYTIKQEVTKIDIKII